MAAEILEKYLNEESLSKQVDMDFRKILISSKRKLKSAEERFTKELKEKGLLSVIPSILNCDMYYVTSGVEVSEYLCDGAEYTRQTEGIRAELLEDGEMSSEIIFLCRLLQGRHMAALIQPMLLCFSGLFAVFCLYSLIWSGYREQFNIRRKLQHLSWRRRRWPRRKRAGHISSSLGRWLL